MSRVVVVIGILTACGRISFDDVDPGNTDVAPGCDDLVRNGDETGIDCGGRCTAKCPLEACESNAACVTNQCSNDRCQLADLAWTPGPSLMNPRSDNECVTRRDGSVFVVDATVELLMPGTNAFVSGPPLNTPRYAFALGVAADDTLIAAMGSTATATTPTVELLATGAAAWVYGTPTSTGREQIRGVVASDGNFYIPDFGLTAIYRPGSDSWGSAAGVERDDYGIAASVDRQLVYVLGGTDAIGDSAAVDVFDVPSQSWSGGAPLPAVREGTAAVTAPDGRIYVVGGMRAGTPQAEVTAYSPADDVHQALPPLGTARASGCATLAADGRVFVIGGFDDVDLGTSELYGPRFSLEPSSAAPGERVAVTGVGFAASAIVRVSFDGTPVAGGVASAGGDASHIFDVPMNAASGSHQVMMIDQRAQYPVTATLVVP